MIGYENSSNGTLTQNGSNTPLCSTAEVEVTNGKGATLQYRQAVVLFPSPASPQATKI